MENNNGKGIFYGVIGVATLIVAIIGATFAYFSATTISGKYVTGTAATAGLSVNVTRLTGFSAGEVGKNETNASYIMVPQLDATLDKAVVGSDNTDDSLDNPTACIDSNGSLVCTIYKITVSNTGSSAIDISGSIAFYTGKSDALTPNADKDGTAVVDDASSVMNHLKWARLANPTTTEGAVNNAGSLIPTKLLDYATDTTYQSMRPVALVGTGYAKTDATPYLYGRTVATEANDLYGADYTNGMTSTAAEAAWITSHTAHTDIIDPTDDLTRAGKVWTTTAGTTPGSIHLQAAGSTVDADADGVKDDTATFYIVVWISENLATQNEVDKGTFVGQVTFNSAGGSGATSTFTEVAANGVEG